MQTLSIISTARDALRGLMLSLCELVYSLISFCFQVFYNLGKANILNNDILTCNKAKVSKYIVKELDKILKRYLNQYVDNIGFKSLNLIESIENKKGAE